MVLTSTGSLTEDVICSRVVQRKHTALQNLREGKFHICNIFSLQFLKRNNFAATPKPKKGKKRTLVSGLELGTCYQHCRARLGVRGLLL